MFWVEIAATVFGLLCVVLTIRRHTWCWPTGLVQVVLYLFVFYQARLYSDVLLHAIYVVLQVYGWYAWTDAARQNAMPSQTETPRDDLPLEELSAASLAMLAGAVVLGTMAWGSLMQRATDASFPYGDAFTTVASLTAQVLLARRFVENWYFWIAVDVVAIGIYARKQLVPTTLLYTVFLGLAITGCVTWQRRLRAQRMVSGELT